MHTSGGYWVWRAPGKVGVMPVALLVVALGCGRMRAAPDRPNLVTTDSHQVDSARAVALAIQAYRSEREKDDSIQVEVSAFTRDTAGVLIHLSPVSPTVRGGGMLVRVTIDHLARIVERYQ